MKTITNCLVRCAVVLAVLLINLLLSRPVCAQTWATNGPMQTARWSHTATLLTNGLVLIAGGETMNRYDIPDSAMRGTNGAELYDPSVGSSTLTSPMNAAHFADTATLLPNGLVLVAGGRNDGGGIVAHSELYDPTAGTWSDTGSMNQERCSFTATLLTNGCVLVVAGYSNSGDTPSAEIYDPITEVWTNAAPMNYATDSQTATLLTNGLVLVAGGSDGGGGALTNSVLYNPANNTWTNTGSLNEARGGHAATLLPNGTVLVVGGTGDNTTEIYNPATATWSVYDNMNDGWSHPNAVLLKTGQVLVVGDGNSDVELYDPQANAWSYTDSLPVTGNSQVATLLSSGQVLVTGGDASYYNGPALDIVETYGSAVTTPGLTVTASPQAGTTPLAVQFSSPDVDSIGDTVTNWNWTFGDGASSTEQNPSHTYTTPGNYSPSLTAYSTYGTTLIIITGPGTISVNYPSLDANATPQDGLVPLMVQFSTPTNDSGGFTVTNWSWSFGDGSTSAAQNPSHTYINPGIYSPSLVAQSTYSLSPVTIVFGFGTITVTNPANPLFKTIYSFTATSGASATNSDGAGPNGGLVLSGNTLYGTTGHGGLAGVGTVFAINNDQTGFTNYLSFNINDGFGANGGLVLSGNTLFGTTYGGGNLGGGTVFAISTNGSNFTNVYYFSLNVSSSSTGTEPAAGLALSGNTLFGTSQYGGYYDNGTVFAVNTNGTGIKVQHSFTPFTGDYRINGDGGGPFARVIFSNGTLYGTTEAGGTSGYGTVFSVTTNVPASFQILHYFSSAANFAGTNSDGGNPFSGLVLSGGILYGTTFDGGNFGYGTVFAVSTNGLFFTNLYSFTGGADGSGPHGGLALSGNVLYGTTSGGGLFSASSSGTLFAIHTDGTGFKTLYNFSGGSDGVNPQGDLLISSNTLYGATSGGGDAGSGTVFSYTLPVSALPLTLLNPRDNGAIFNFTFQSQSGFTHSVLYRTNLVLGNWQTFSNVTGDGALKTIPIPLSIFSPSQQGFIRVSTQ